ncbi:MAG: LAGLIDADG family homing endonuclease [archaeon]
MEIKKVPGNILGIFWTTASWVPSDENNGSISITNEDENILKEIKNFLLKYEINYSYYNGPPDKKNRKNYKYEYYRMKIYN